MSSIIERIADRFPGLGVKLAYGERTEVAGHQLVPVAVVAYGFGAGEGEGTMPEPGPEGTAEQPARRMSGSGGGGGGLSMPIGAYVERGGRLVFRPNPIALLVVGLPVVTALGVGIAAVLKAR